MRTTYVIGYDICPGWAGGGTKRGGEEGIFSGLRVANGLVTHSLFHYRVSYRRLLEIEGASPGAGGARGDCGLSRIYDALRRREWCGAEESGGVAREGYEVGTGELVVGVQNL